MATLTRPREQRLVAGVCAGLGKRFGVDPNVVRLAICVLALARGLGVAVYLALWLAMPAEGAGKRPATSRLKYGMTEAGELIGGVLDRVRAAWTDRRHGGTLLRPVGIVLIAGGTFVLLRAIGLYSWIGPTGWVAVAAIVVGAGLVFLRSARSRR